VNMIYLHVDFLVLRVMIRYHNMISLSSLSSLTDASHQLFACIECMIQLTSGKKVISGAPIWTMRGAYEMRHH
jgi:hypothetical protein